MSFYSYSCLIGSISIDLDFSVRTRRYEKRLTGKQPSGCLDDRLTWVIPGVLN